MPQHPYFFKDIVLYDTDTGYMDFLFESSIDTLYFRVFSELAICGDSLSVNALVIKADNKTASCND